MNKDTINRIIMIREEHIVSKYRNLTERKAKQHMESMKLINSMINFKEIVKTLLNL